MKKTFTYTYTPSLIMLIAMILCVAPYALAQEDVYRGNANQHSTTKPIEKTRETLPKSLPDVAQKRIENLVKNVNDRIVALMVRQNNIVTRIESRVNKMKNNGLDVTEAQKNIENIKDIHAHAIESINKLSSFSIRSEKPHESLMQLRSDILATQQFLRDAQKLLYVTVEQLKNIEKTNSTKEDVGDALLQNEKKDADIKQIN